MEPVWYYVSNGAQSDPVSFAQLKDAAAAGKLTPNDLVWQEGTPDWVPARTVTGLFPSSSPPPAPSRPAVMPPTYSLSPSPPPPPSASPAPLPLDPEPLPLDDEPRAPRPPRATPEWVKLVQTFCRRAFDTDPARSAPNAEEEATLTRAGVMDPTIRKFAVWRRGLLFVAAVPCAFAALFGLIQVAAMEEGERKMWSGFGLFLHYVQALLLFALPVTAVLGALAYDRLSASAKWVLVGGLISLATPLTVAFVPATWQLDLKTDVDGAREGAGFGLGLYYYLLLAPTVLSLWFAYARASLRLKLLLPESIVTGWGLIVFAPLCVLLTLATFLFPYHFFGNVLLTLGVVVLVGAPLLYLVKFRLLARPVTAATDRATLERLALGVLGLTLLGALLVVIFLFATKYLGRTILGFDEHKTYVRPWDIGLHKMWLEIFGRSLFLTVLFADLFLWILLSMWREERAFAGTPEAANFDRTMAALGSAIAPATGGPEPAPGSASAPGA